MKKEWKIFGALAGIFLVAYFLPLGNPKVSSAIFEAFRLLQWYVREHTLACVVPAMFIAGGIATFLSQASVMRYLGPKSNRLLAYSVASISGCILAVCSCTSTELVEHYLKWNEKSKGALILKKVCGVLVLLAGVWLIYTAP